MEAAKNVNQLLAQLKPQLPQGMEIVPSFDISTYMNESVHEVYLSYWHGHFMFNFHHLFCSWDVYAQSFCLSLLLSLSV
ncbi:efflux RND transporter permease subunit [Candidatus Coxiella mudrowiae]|uniref:efflux RND transporter permease subunit n=1 Tax=Candidatus Coxiella mudrowiae TaxID=2054173 RepID=UPI001FD2D0AD|nr:efflux RND transporter permease subunit [Candidatus Coxiella mudrowiae]